MDTVWLVLRVVNVALAVGVLCVLASRAREAVRLPLPWSAYALGLGVLVFVTAYGAVEALLTGVPGGSRVALRTVALLALTVASLPRSWLLRLIHRPTT